MDFCAEDAATTYYHYTAHLEAAMIVPKCLFLNFDEQRCTSVDSMRCSTVRTPLLTWSIITRNGAQNKTSMIAYVLHVV